MYQVLSKDIIEKEIIPLIPINKSGPAISVPLEELINCILYKLKTGVQWEYLPIESLFSEKALHYKTVFGHYRKWSKQGFGKIAGFNFYPSTDQNSIYQVAIWTVATQQL